MTSQIIAAKKTYNTQIAAFKKWGKATLMQFGALGATYGMIISVLLLMRVMFGEQSSLITFLNHLLPWLLLGCVVSTIITLAAPYRNIWLLYSLPGVIVFVWLYAPLFIPSLPETDTYPDQSLSVATYNVQLLLGNRDAENIEQRWNLIETLDADIIGVQEVTGNPYLDVANPYPYSFFAGTIGLMSRYPFEREAVETFGTRFGPDEPSLLRAEVDVNGQKIAVYSGHLVRPQMRLRPLSFSSKRRAEAVSLLTARLEKETLPYLLLCDCNMTSDTGDYRQIADYMQDSWRERGFGFGFTAPADPNDLPFPVIRSDYIWYSGLELTGITRWSDDGGSDHFPLRATVNLPD